MHVRARAFIREAWLNDLLINRNFIVTSPDKEISTLLFLRLSLEIASPERLAEAND